MDIDLLSHQYEAIFENKKYTLLAGGVGSGKTFAGTHFVVNQLSQQPGQTGLITATTYQQMRDVSLNALFNTFADLGIQFSYNKIEMTVEVMGSKILCRSSENHVKWKGIEISWAWCDEYAYAKKDAWDTLVARLRERNGKYQVLVTTTPKGFNWLYEQFLGEYRTDNHMVVKAKTRENDYLPETFEDDIRAQYDDLVGSQELDGEFVNVTAGKIYYSFSRELNVKPIKRHPRYPIWVGVDFNVDPMTASVCQIIDGHLYVLDEFFLRNSNTYALCQAILGKYGPDCTIVPDSTGKKMTTNANVSDIQILQKHFTKVHTAGNPFRVDRYAAVNGALANGLVTIDPSCQYLIRDLENVTYKEGTDHPSTENHLLTHASDNLGYVIFRTVNPLRDSQLKVRTQKR